MSTTRAFVEGQTAPEVVTLYDGDGATRTAINGTGLTVTLVLRDRAEALVPVNGNVDWSDAAAGEVTYSPAATDLRAANSPYTARFRVTDSFGKWKDYPTKAVGKSNPPETWIVAK